MSMFIFLVVRSPTDIIFIRMKINHICPFYAASQKNIGIFIRLDFVMKTTATRCWVQPQHENRTTRCLISSFPCFTLTALRDSISLSEQCPCLIRNRLHRNSKPISRLWNWRSPYLHSCINQNRPVPGPNGRLHEVAHRTGASGWILF